MHLHTPYIFACDSCRKEWEVFPSFSETLPYFCSDTSAAETAARVASLRSEISVCSLKHPSDLPIFKSIFASFSSFIFYTAPLRIGGRASSVEQTTASAPTDENCRRQRASRGVTARPNPRAFLLKTGRGSEGGLDVQCRLPSRLLALSPASETRTKTKTLFVT